MTDRTKHPDSDQPGVEATPPADSTIPESETGVAAGYTGEPSTFEPEEDSDADADGEATDAGKPMSGGTGPRSTEAQSLTGEDLKIFQSHWDDFADHID